MICTWSVDSSAGNCGAGVQQLVITNTVTSIIELKLKSVDAFINLW
jgi:hypothetical protein